MNELHHEVNLDHVQSAVDFLLYYQRQRRRHPAITAHSRVAYQASLRAVVVTSNVVARGTICWEFSDGSRLLRDANNNYAAYPKGHHA